MCVHKKVTVPHILRRQQQVHLASCIHEMKRKCLLCKFMLTNDYSTLMQHCDWLAWWRETLTVVTESKPVMFQFQLSKKNVGIRNKYDKNIWVYTDKLFGAHVPQGHLSLTLNHNCLFAQKKTFRKKGSQKLNNLKLKYFLWKPLCSVLLISGNHWSKTRPGRFWKIIISICILQMEHKHNCNF